jgi:hypothetical protein
VRIGVDSIPDPEMTRPTKHYTCLFVQSRNIKQNPPLKIQKTSDGRTWFDFHFYRLNANGMWSHKAGNTAPEIVYHPSITTLSDFVAYVRYFQRGGVRYTKFCGCYVVSAEVHEALGEIDDISAEWSIA